jgi:hypothetical protein
LIGTNGTGDPWASLSINLQAVALGTKVPTFLWLPTSNSTVNGLPVGLKRYTGEQSFDLLVVDATSILTSDSITLPWGGTYKVTLQSGVNEILVPREQFLGSPIGRAIFENKSEPYNSSGPTPPMLGLSGVQSLITSFDGANLYSDLAAYWQNRAVHTGTGTMLSTESGTSNTSSNSLDVVAVTSPPSNNTGGLPSSPTLLNSSNANALTAAIQSVMTLNVTSKSMLDALVAGISDNSSNGINGTLATITSQVAFLRFDSAVSSALVNAVPVSDGLCGAPQSQYPPPPPTSSGLWGDFVNAVSSVIQTVAGAIVSLVSVVYTAAIAAANFVAHLARTAAAIGGQLIARTVTGLISIGSAIETALAKLLSWLWSVITNFVEGALKSFVTPFQKAFNTWGTDASECANDTLAAFKGTNVGQNEAAAESLLTTVLLLPAAIAGALTVAVEGIFVITTPFDIAGAAVTDFVLPILVTLLSSALALSGPGSNLGSITSYLSNAASNLGSVAMAAAEYVFNHTSGYSSTAISDLVYPGTHGDFWSFLGVVFAGGAAGLSKISLSNIDPATQLNPFNSDVKNNIIPTDEAESAFVGLVFGVFSCVILVAEYLLSLVLPKDNFGTSAVEILLEIGAEFCALIGLSQSWDAVFNDQPGVDDLPIVQDSGIGAIVAAGSGMVLGFVDIGEAIATG